MSNDRKKTQAKHVHFQRPSAMGKNQATPISLADLSLLLANEDDDATVYGRIQHLGFELKEPLPKVDTATWDRRDSEIGFIHADGKPREVTPGSTPSSHTDKIRQDKSEVSPSHNSTQSVHIPNNIPSDILPLEEEDITPVSNAPLWQFSPITPWARIWPAVKLWLSSATNGKVNTSRMVEMIGKGEIVRKLPLLARNDWAADAWVLFDINRRTHLFYDDFLWFEHHLTSQRGTQGLAVWAIDDDPFGVWQSWGNSPCDNKVALLPPMAAPLLIISDLGMFKPNATATKARWRRFASELAKQGKKASVFIPLSSSAMDVELAHDFNIVRWSEDGHLKSIKPNKYGLVEGMPLQNQQQIKDDAFLDFLTLFATTIRIEPPLLRRVRRELAQRPFDSGLEAKLWNAPAFTPDVIACAVNPGKYEELRQAFLRIDPARQTKLRELITLYHRHLSPLIGHEETLIWNTYAQAQAKADGDRAILDSLTFMQRFTVTVGKGANERNAQWLAYANRYLARSDGKMLSEYPHLLNLTDYTTASIEEDVDYLYEAKLIILGEGGAGKTSLLRRLYHPALPLPDEAHTTRGIDIHRHDFKLANGRNFRLNVLDFGGQAIYYATHQFFLTHRSLYVLVVDSRHNDKTVSDPGFKYWLDLIELFGGDSPVFIFQNEKAGRSRTIDFDGIRARYPHVMKSFNGNLEHDDAANTIRKEIESFASRLPHIGDQLPAAWVKVRADIENAAQSEPYISFQQYLTIYERHLPANREKALHLSRYLHDLGVFLHFQDDKLLAKTVILQNQWATEAVYKLLDDEQIKAKTGRFNDADCARLLADTYYTGMHNELMALMQNFELCYLLPDSTPTTWLAPQLMQTTKPPALRDWNHAGDLVLRYRYAIMPGGLISRLFVRLHRFVPTPENACITCVQFQQAATLVLAELLPDGLEIELRARGPGRKALLSVVASDLEAINSGFHGLRGKVDKLIPCNCPQCSASKTPHLFNSEQLRKRLEANRLKIECPLSYKEDVDVLALLDGISMVHLPLWAAEMDEESAQTAKPPATMRKFSIFLASSSELRDERDAFDLYFRQLNDQLRESGIYLTITRWENFLDAMAAGGLQEEYNQAVRASDVFVSLFGTKAGKYTEQEFDAAFGQFISSGSPRIYTYFKEAHVKASSAQREDLLALWAFQDKLKALGHYPTDYENIEHLKLQFRAQLDQLLGMLGV